MNYINFKSADGAELWAKEVDTLNETTMQLLQKVGTCLQSLKEDADSAVVDEIYHYGGNVLEGAVSVVGGMGAVTASIRQIVRYLEEINRNGVDIVHNAIRGIGGFEAVGAVGAGGSGIGNNDPNSPASFMCVIDENGNVIPPSIWHERDLKLIDPSKIFDIIDQPDGGGDPPVIPPIGPNNISGIIDAIKKGSGGGTPPAGPDISNIMDIIKHGDIQYPVVEPGSVNNIMDVII